MQSKQRWFGLPLIWQYLTPYRSLILMMAVLGTMSSLIDALYPLFHRYALNHFVALKTMDTTKVFVILYVLLLVIQVACNFISSYMISQVEMYVGRDLKNAAFNHLQTLSFSYFNTHNVGSIHARVMSDTDRIGTLVSWRLMDFVWYLSYLVCVFVVMIAVDWRLTLCVAALLPMALVMTTFFQRRLIRENRIVRDINSRLTGHWNEGISGLRSIKTLAAERVMSEEFEDTAKDMRTASVKAVRTSSLFTALMTLTSTTALALVLWQGGHLSVQGLMDIGTLSVFMTYALSMMEPIQYIVSAIAAMMSAQVNIERFDTLMHVESDVSDREDVIEKYGDAFNPVKDNWEDLHGDVRFEDVTFRYPDGDENVLEHFNLHVKKGMHVAIVGPTGAGKSTLVNLVCRFYEPSAGRVLIDGVDARDRSTLWLHSHLGYVLQSPQLFSGSVRDNMRYGAPEATDEDIWNALDLVSAHDVVERMGHGLDSEVGAGGERLSAGEKQLLSFARALIADPAILVLDEATASIDTLTEKKIQDAILKITAGRTAFMIAHRLSTITDADIIIVMDDGKIVENGTHQDLLARKGRYYELYTTQYEQVATADAL